MGGTWVVWVGLDVGKFSRREGLIDLVVTEWQADHRSEVAHALPQVD
ncbi:hypothetical protein [Rhodococcus tibetensis]|uniref:Transposase n=1 Tax=Rhodococcus tibetensis TaxID=2965064 RepID=A0ABT1Q7X6_9NOCA|nr:hypothetical protein [Rhodococcus sp. FXJ9.536]MCQ4118357.1 hypothetical protein [Rhodococcus sp. FXJ9.536]